MTLLSPDWSCVPEKAPTSSHIDVLSCLQSAISRGFNIESLHSLAQLYIHHRFFTEADGFLSEIPVMGERGDEPQGGNH